MTPDPGDSPPSELEPGLDLDGVCFVQHEYVDQTGTVRGKVSRIESLAKTGSLINLALCTRSADDIVMTPFAGEEDGFVKLPLKPDLSSAFVMPWRPNTVAVLSDMFEATGEACRLCPRQVLKNAVGLLEQQGLEVSVGIEWEFYLFEHDEDAIVEGRIPDLRPVGRNRHSYSLLRAGRIRSVLEELLSRLDAAGMPAESYTTEYGKGMYEIAFEPLPALAAADGLARARLYGKELLLQRDMTLTAMPALHLDSGDTLTGVHFNVSLWRDGENVLWDPESGGLSEWGARFGAGMLETMDDFHLLFRPWVNSYRRFDPDAFSAAHVAWGLDHHMVSQRLVHGPAPEKDTRWEHRVAGTDVCPHLALAAVLLGGHHGLEHQLELPPPVRTSELADAPRLAASLPSAIERFRGSDTARRLLGSEFVEHFCQIRDEEWADYAAWCEQHGLDIDHNGPGVTEWEYRRYFDWLQ